MQALVLAGSRGPSPLVEEAGVKNKSLIPIHGKPMIQYVLETLNSVSIIERIVVVGPLEELGRLETEITFSMVSEKGEIMENLLEGFRHISPSAGPVLVATSDIPLITREALEHFIEKGLHLEADFCYPILEKEVVEQKYANVVRTYARLKEGSFTGGNIFLINAEIVAGVAERAAAFLALRKKPHRMALKLGLPFIIKFLLKKVTIADAEKRASEIFGVKGRAVIMPHAEIGFDVDKTSDLKIAEEYLYKRA